MGKRTACGFFVAAVMALLASCAGTCPEGLVRDPSNSGQCTSTPETTAEEDSADALIIDMLKEECSAGSAEACTDLGELYLTGITVTDSGTARASRRALDGERYLQRACDREYAQACVKLADAYRTDDVLQDSQKAKEYDRRACSLEWEPSCKRVDDRAAVVRDEAESVEDEPTRSRRADPPDSGASDAVSLAGGSATRVGGWRYSEDLTKRSCGKAARDGFYGSFAKLRTVTWTSGGMTIDGGKMSDQIWEDNSAGPAVVAAWLTPQGDLLVAVGIGVNVDTVRLTLTWYNAGLEIVCQDAWQASR